MWFVACTRWCVARLRCVGVWRACTASAVCAVVCVRVQGVRCVCVAGVCVCVFMFAQYRQTSHTDQERRSVHDNFLQHESLRKFITFKIQWSFYQDVHQCCHGMLVRPGFSFTPKKVWRCFRANNISPQSCSFWLNCWLVFCPCWPLFRPG